MLMLNPERKWTQAEFEDKVRNVGASFTEEECKNLLRSNHAWMLHMLEVHGGEDEVGEDQVMEQDQDQVRDEPGVDQIRDEAVFDDQEVFEDDALRAASAVPNNQSLV